MRIVDIREKTFPLNVAMTNAAIAYDDMTASVVAVVTDVVRDGKPVIGYGFDSIGRYGHGRLMMERFAPRVLAAPPESLLDDAGTNFEPVRVWARAMRNEKPAGHGERAGAIGLLDAAVWDAVAKIAGKPLYRVLSARYGDGNAPARVPTYGSGGHYTPDGRVEGLVDAVRRMLDEGYTHIKIKGGGGPLAEDLRRIEAVLKLLPSGDRLALDLSGTFDAARGKGYLDAVRPYGLRWVEEVGDPLDYELQADFSAYYDGGMAAGENLCAAIEVRNLLRHGGLRPDLDVLQFDVSLSYGIVEYARIIAILEAAGWSRRRLFPHAGHVFALHVVAGLGLGSHESAPDGSKIFGGFPEGCRVEDGTVNAPDLSGVGFEAKPNLWAIMRELAD